MARRCSPSWRSRGSLSASASAAFTRSPRQSPPSRRATRSAAGTRRSSFRCRASPTWRRLSCRGPSSPSSASPPPARAAQTQASPGGSPSPSAPSPASSSSRAWARDGAGRAEARGTPPTSGCRRPSQPCAPRRGGRRAPPPPCCRRCASESIGPSSSAPRAAGSSSTSPFTATRSSSRPSYPPSSTSTRRRPATRRRCRATLRTTSVRRWRWWRRLVSPATTSPSG
mmetsp:Transcript_32108/g.102732  ORF Transcript_32108/g.102732 Transcript_32108/m.102732 type:complete len:227 (+) Transcript_32108:342-1022(+)